MTEDEARKKLQEILDWQYANRINYSEANLNSGEKHGFVEFYIAKIYKECEGSWDDSKAQTFMISLEREATSIDHTS